jgi:acid phosphatase
MITGNLIFTESDILFFPYLCAYESQILGTLSPWCGVFTDDELKSYEYSQDLSYFYGEGPGSTGPAQKVFLPFLDGLMSLFIEGPGKQGKGTDGSTFTLPDLIMSFLNDGQIAEMTAAMGIFDAEGNLPIDYIPKNYLYNVAHFITMRGTVAFEVLNCDNSAPLPSSTASIGPTSTVSSKGFSTGSTTKTENSSVSVTSGVTTVTTSYSTPTGPTRSSQSGVITVTVTATASECSANSIYPTTPYFKRSQTDTNQTYIRILFNDAVYPITSCQNGPGNSCLLSKYAAFIHEKNTAAGEFKDYCNVTTANAQTNINGAGFFTDLTLDYLTFLKPFF